MSYEKPTRPILKVFKPRSLVDLAAAVSSALLINEPQLVGIFVKPINYSLKGAVLHIDTDLVLRIEESHAIELERYADISEDPAKLGCSDGARNDGSSVTEEFKQLTLHGSASDLTSVLWIPVRAMSESIPRGTNTAVPPQQIVVDGLRTRALKLEFGVSHNQTFERTLAVHFTDPFHVSTRVADKCSDGTLLLQLILLSQVKASMSIYDAWLDIQDGFAHTGQGDGRPASGFFPLVVSPMSRAGMLFSICLANTVAEDEATELHPDSILNIRYGGYDTQRN